MKTFRQLTDQLDESSDQSTHALHAKFTSHDLWKRKTPLGDDATHFDSLLKTTTSQLKPHIKRAGFTRVTGAVDPSNPYSKTHEAHTTHVYDKDTGNGTKERIRVEHNNGRVTGVTHYHNSYFEKNFRK